MFRSRQLLLFAFVIAIIPAAARADDDNVQKARTDFIAGADHVKNARWGEALAAFERSASLRPHALTTFNIGACERALGRYTRAKASLQKALEANEASGGHDLAKSFADDARRWIAEIDAIVVVATVTLVPADATLLVDGAPLVAEQEKDHFVAGFPASERSQKAPGAKFTMRIDPGDHIFALSRTGFANGVVSKSLAPGSKPELTLDLKSLPATIRVAANQPGAVVSVDDLDSGVAPVQISRPGNAAYHVVVRKAGYVPYSTTVRVNPGDNPSLQATLVEEKQPIYQKVWFWTAAAAVVAGAAVGTYLLTRPDPERPAPNGGGLGWVVSVPAPGAR